MNIFSKNNRKIGRLEFSKFKIGFFSILLSTFLLIGFLSFLIEKSVPRVDLSEIKNDKKSKKASDELLKANAKDKFKRQRIMPTNS